MLPQQCNRHRLFGVTKSLPILGPRQISVCCYFAFFQFLEKSWPCHLICKGLLETARLLLKLFHCVWLGLMYVWLTRDAICMKDCSDKEGDCYAMMWCSSPGSYTQEADSIFPSQLSVTNINSNSFWQDGINCSLRFYIFGVRHMVYGLWCGASVSGRFKHEEKEIPSASIGTVQTWFTIGPSPIENWWHWTFEISQSNCHIFKAYLEQHQLKSTFSFLIT